MISWNDPSWSISAELFAYLLLPFLLRGLVRAATPVVLLAVAASMAAISCRPELFVIKALGGAAARPPLARAAAATGSRPPAPARPGSR